MADYSFNAELYDNPLTEKAGDFIAPPIVGALVKYLTYKYVKIKIQG